MSITIPSFIFILLLITSKMIFTSYIERRINKSDSMSLLSVRDMEIRVALEQLAEDIPMCNSDNLYRVHNSWGTLVAKVHKSQLNNGKPMLTIWAHKTNLKKFVAITQQLSGECKAKKNKSINSQEKERLEARKMLGLSASQQQGQLSLVEKQ